MNSFGQAQVPPPYTPLVWDENWSYLSERSKALDWTDTWQHINLFGDAYLSIGGQIRERGEYIDHPNFAASPAHDGYLLQRYLLDSDWQFSHRFRFFVQLAGSFESGRDGGPRPGIDQDTLYSNQAFIDWSPSEKFTVRMGQQLISLGSARLFAIGYGLNIEQPFVGARIMAQAGGWAIDLLALRPTRIANGYFDNTPNPQVEAWGFYGTHSLASSKAIKIDLNSHRRPAVSLRAKFEHGPSDITSAIAFFTRL